MKEREKEEKKETGQGLNRESQTANGKNYSRLVNFLSGRVRSVNVSSVRE